MALGADLSEPLGSAELWAVRIGWRTAADWRKALRIMGLQAFLAVRLLKTLGKISDFYI